MIYTQYGVPVEIVGGRFLKKAPRVPGWELDLKCNDGREITRYAHELKADGGMDEIMKEASRFEQVF